MQKVLVSARPLSRGKSPSAADVKSMSKNTTALSYGFLTAASQLQGQRLNRSISEDTVITPSMLEARTLIHRGQHVTLVANAGGVEVRSTGEALGDAVRGAHIQVRNLRSHRVVEGVVKSTDVVEVLP